MTFIEYRRQRAARGTEADRRQRRRRRRSRRSDRRPRFVIQRHATRPDHYDLRLEIDGVLVSWTIPKQPSVDPQDGRLARRTEDHRLDGEDGGGRDIAWDRGTYDNRTEHTMTTCLGRGHLSFQLQGEKLRGGYALTRIREGEYETWLLLKRKYDDVDTQPDPARSESA